MRIHTFWSLADATKRFFGDTVLDELHEICEQGMFRCFLFLPLSCLSGSRSCASKPFVLQVLLICQLCSFDYSPSNLKMSFFFCCSFVACVFALRSPLSCVASSAVELSQAFSVLGPFWASLFHGPKLKACCSRFLFATQVLGPEFGT